MPHKVHTLHGLGQLRVQHTRWQPTGGPTGRMPALKVRQSRALQLDACQQPMWQATGQAGLIHKAARAGVVLGYWVAPEPHESSPLYAMQRTSSPFED